MKRSQTLSTLVLAYIFVYFFLSDLLRKLLNKIQTTEHSKYRIQKIQEVTTLITSAGILVITLLMSIELLK